LQFLHIAAGRITLKKYVVTEVVLFFSCCFKTLTFHNVVWRHILGVLLILIVKKVWKLVNIWWSY